jgi:hypothetical protein
MGDKIDRKDGTVDQEGSGDEEEKQMGPWKLGLYLLTVIFFSFIPLSPADAQGNWALTLYSGRLTDSNLAKTATFNFDFEDSYFIDLALSRRLYTYRDYFNLEIEGQIAKHFGDQHHWEFNGVAYLRWLPFPWDSYLDTSFAAGVGLSYATSVPEVEAKNHEEAAKFLGALMFELAFSHPRIPQWGLVTRLHHRSGAWGLFNDVHGASNAWAIGLRYAF